MTLGTHGKSEDHSLFIEILRCRGGNPAKRKVKGKCNWSPRTRRHTNNFFRCAVRRPLLRASAKLQVVYAGNELYLGLLLDYVTHNSDWSVGNRSGDAARGHILGGSVGTLSVHCTYTRVPCILRFSFPRVFTESPTDDIHEHDQSVTEKRTSVPQRVAGRAVRRCFPADLHVVHSNRPVLSIFVCVRALQVERAAGSRGQLAADFRLQFDDHETGDTLGKSSVRHRARRRDFEFFWCVSVSAAQHRRGFWYRSFADSR